LAVPSKAPLAPPPASVVTSPAAETRRILLLTLSATTSRPRPSIARPRGVLKPAAEPTPSAKPLVVSAPLPPARVVVAPVETTTARMMWFPSDTYASEPFTATPLGAEKRAFVPAASRNPASVPLAPPPAIVAETLPFAHARRSLCDPRSTT